MNYSSLCVVSECGHEWVVHLVFSQFMVLSVSL